MKFLLAGTILYHILGKLKPRGEYFEAGTTSERIVAPGLLQVE